MTETEDLFARENQVTADDRAALVEALAHAYPTRSFLYLRLANKMGVVVADDVIALNNPGREILEAIVTFADSQGKFLELLAVTWTDVPGNPKLRELAEKFFPDPPRVIAKYASSPTPLAAATPHASLEKVIDKRSRRFNLAAYLDGVRRLSGAICTVGTPDVQGTGFLVGKHSVLTNFHVVRDAIKGDYAGDSIVCTFDYSDDTSPTVAFHGAVGWLRSKSPYSQSDLTGSGQPGPDELDYALITLAQDVEPTRRALTWPIAAPIVSQRDLLTIAQHPRGEAAQIAFGEVVELPGSGLRYRYDVTTLSGSSGSPVLSLDLELVALHHAADPDKDPSYNQAVPIARIMAQLKAENIELASL